MNKEMAGTKKEVAETKKEVGETKKEVAEMKKEVALLRPALRQGFVRGGARRVGPADRSHETGAPHGFAWVLSREALRWRI